MMNQLIFFSSDKANEIDGLESVHVLAWTSKVPKMGQPDLDYMGKCVTTCVGFFNTFFEI